MAPASTAEAVVLLHGLGRSPRSLAKMEATLRARGYTTHNIGYPSMRHPIETLAERYVLPHIRSVVEDPSTMLHFVTHSMGGIIVRQLHTMTTDLCFGRVVMLGPPNHGSEVVDRLRDWPPFRWANGPAGQQLGTDSASVPRQLGPARFALGVIAGDRPFLEPFRHYIAGPSDGKVSVASTKLDGMQDFRVLPVTHALMMRSPAVITQTIAFLSDGRFAP